MKFVGLRKRLGKDFLVAGEVGEKDRKIRGRGKGED